MASGLLNPRSAGNAKSKQEKAAQEMQQAVLDRANKLGVEPPDYEFLELIGKGTFGRVFKSRKRSTNELVAIKVMDIDKSDYFSNPEIKDQGLKDYINEISVLRELKESRAKNVNVLIDAFALHSQLWIVSEYCPGGSVNTLMKASLEPGLEEKYIIPIARELAVALKYVHDAKIIHRDIKCANILITEDGEVQLCDFGVAGTLDTGMDKRSTIIGTPFWMPPEMHTTTFAVPSGYGTEVDCWAFGCTVYEMATGNPPNTRYHHTALREVLKTAPRLEGDKFSQELKDFVAFCLREEPTQRPDAGQIMEHPYIHGTSEKYPTAILTQLLERYTLWEESGGQRASLFNGMGAEAPEILPAIDDDDDYWNFSTTEEFKKRMSRPLDALAGFGVESQDFAPEPAAPAAPGRRNFARFEKAQNEARARRGELALARIFDQNAEPYQYSADEFNDGHDDDDDGLIDLDMGSSMDLPYRKWADPNANNRETLIDMDLAFGSSGEAQMIDLADIRTVRARSKTHFSRFLQGFDDDSDGARNEADDEGTLRFGHENANRATKEWKFPAFAEDDPVEDAAKRRVLPTSAPLEDNPNRRTMDWTFPTFAEPKTSSLDVPTAYLASPPGIVDASGNPAFRPALKHTVTEPVGSFGDFVHEQLLASGSAPPSPIRMSVIDLDEAFGTSNHVARPSTASSIADSTMTESTTGNPFDLEDVQDHLNTMRASRASFHQKSQSEPQRTSQGFDKKTFEYVYAHSRDSSTDSDFFKSDTSSVREARREADHYWDTALDDYSRAFSANATPVSVTSNGLDEGDWSTYGPPSSTLVASEESFGENTMRKLPTVADHNYPLLMSATSDTIPRRRPHIVSGADGQPAVVWSHPEPPSPSALAHNAPDDTVMAELDRLLQDLEGGYAVVEKLMTADDGPAAPRVIQE